MDVNEVIQVPGGESASVSGLESTSYPGDSSWEPVDDGGGQPFFILAHWLRQAIKMDIQEPLAMVLSTSSLHGDVSSRVVLLKKLTEEGLFFYTNYDSLKGEQISQNPKAALNFYWDKWCRQVRIEGLVQRASRKDSENYWKQRPRGSQISQFFSRQSQSVSEFYSLKGAYKECEQEWANKKEIPCPKNWGGYQLIPERIEFWLKEENRLHQRWLYERIQSQRKQWKLTQLYP